MIPYPLNKFSTRADQIKAINLLLARMRGALLPYDTQTRQASDGGGNLGSILNRWDYINVNGLGGANAIINNDLLEELTTISPGTLFGSSGTAPITWGIVNIGRNLINNSLFRVSSYNRSFPYVIPNSPNRWDKYIVDRWFSDTGATINIDSYGLRLTNGVSIYQTINRSNITGGVYTLSWGTLDGINPISNNLAYSFGSSVNSDTGIAGNNFIPVTNKGQTVSIPAGDYVTIRITATSNNMLVGYAQFEKGVQASDVEDIEYTIDALNCAKYYNYILRGVTLSIGYNTTEPFSYGGYAYIPYPVVMVKAPTATTNPPTDYQYDITDARLLIRHTSYTAPTAPTVYLGLFADF